MLKAKVIDKLIKFHEDNLESKIKEKAHQDEVVSGLQNNIDALAYEIEREKRSATANPEIAYAFQNYYKQAKMKMLDLATRLTLAQLKLDGIIEELKDLYIEINKYEHLSANLKKTKAAQLEKEESKLLDDFNITNYGKPQ